MNIPDPKKLNDPDKLRKLMANAIRLGHPDLAFDCKLRIAELVANTHPVGLDRDFWAALALAEEMKTEANGKTSRLAKARTKFSKSGARQALEDWVQDATMIENFERLVTLGHGDLTAEAVVLRHRDQFTANAVEASRIKLVDKGVEIEEA